MKNILLLVFIIPSFALFISSCQKEISNETGNGLDSAAGTLKDTSGNCLPDSVHGTYYNGITPGGDTCFVEIQVDVTQTGSYNISTDLQNGFQFVDSGFFNATGINIIRLKPIGTPILPLTTTFTVSFDSSVCSFFVDVKDSTGTGLGHSDAKGTLKDSLGNCLPDSVYGTYYNGITPGSDTCFVEMQVNVTQTGPYNISTDLQNGFQFADAGVFNITGINTIRLKPVGMPVIPITTNFTVSFDGSACSFSVDVKDSTGTGLGGGDTTVNIADNSWMFTANGQTFSGSIINAQLVVFIGAQLTLTGGMQSGSTDTVFQLSVQFPGNNIATGTYLTSTPGTSLLFGKLPSGDVIFVANAISPQVTTINVTSYNSTTKVVAGTFSGEVYDFSGNTVQITNGAFKATVP